ncbi:MAG: glycosyltransferase family 2 protein [Lentisphaeria bacterium]|nr:glycosyltransferase family 2 protein [Lentisphaeria bacterium]
MATYNSSRFIRGQLDSLLTQEWQDFEILIRDGGSSDNTLDVISSYLSRFPGKIRITGSSKASALDNFSKLLEESTADLVMFCDHDDVWKPDKIGITVGKYREMEKRFGKEMPMMVFTDSEVVDEKLDRVSSSMIKFQHLDPLHLSLNRLIVQNVPSGNTMLVNRALIDLVLPIPPEAVMHDHWITLAAAAMGRIGFLDVPTLYYRQHSANVYGACQYSVSSFLKKLRQGRRKLQERFEQNVLQAAAFGRRYAGRLSAEDKEMCSALAEWPKLGFWARRRLLWKYRIFKSGLLRNIGTFLFI